MEKTVKGKAALEALAARFPQLYVAPAEDALAALQPVLNLRNVPQVPGHRLVDEDRLAGFDKGASLLDMTIPVGGVDNHAVHQIHHLLGLLDRMGNLELLGKLLCESGAAALSGVPACGNLGVEESFGDELTDFRHPSLWVRGAKTN